MPVQRQIQYLGEFILATSTTKTFQFRTIVLAVSAACVGFSAHAQESGQKEKNNQTLQQVEILAKLSTEVASIKSNAALRDVPVTLSVVPADVLQDQGALTLDAAIKNVSGLSQSSTNNYGYFNNYLGRGLPVNFLRDGLPDGPAVNGYARTLTDVQQIEVLKGPGSALYGSGTPGGFVNLVTKRPSATAANTLELGAGSFNAYHGKIDLTGPIDSDINYRLIGSYANTDGYRGYGNKTIEVLPSFTIRSGSDQLTTIDIRHFDSTIHNDSVGIPFRNHEIINVPQENRYYTPFSESVSEINRVMVKHDMILNADWSLRANYAYGKRDLDFLRNVPSWRLNDPVTGTQIVNRTWRDQKDRLTDSSAQVEAIWNGAFGSTKHEILFGAGWNSTEGVTTRKQALLAPIADIFALVFPEKSNAELDQVLAWRREVKTVQTSLYMQDQIAVSKELKLRAGLRYDNNTIDDNGDYNTLFDAGGAFLTTLASNQQSFKSKPPVMKREVAKIGTHKVNPSLGAVYQPNETSSYYIGASSGSFSNFTTEMGRTAFKPESSKQLEIGTKSVFFNGLLSSNVAIYETRRENFFQTANGLTGTIGSSKTQGLDAELVARPVTGLQVRLAYAYQDAVHTKYVNVVTNVNDLTVIGKRVPGASQNQISLWSSYDLQSASLRGFGVGGGVSYRDAFYADALNTNLAPAKPVLDLVAYYRGKRFDVQLNVNNATNARWYRYATGDIGVAPGDARSANLVTRFKF
jgi:iron complex outermembrane receptor protein